MDAKQVSAYRELKDAGANVSKTNSIEFNAGSETAKHLVAKALVGDIARKHGYRVSSEVGVPSGEIDTLIWGHPKRQTYAVEVETSPTNDVVSSKLNRYVRQVEPVDDLVLVNLSELPMDMLAAREQIAQELGLHE